MQTTLVAVGTPLLQLVGSCHHGCASSVAGPTHVVSGFSQVVARNNPVTIWCNLARYLSSGPVAIVDFQSKLPVDTFEGLVFKSTAWIVGLLVVFVPLAIHLYRKLD